MPLILGLSSLLAAGSADAAVTILADDFTGVDVSGSSATFTSWDTVNGITAPASSLTFYNANDTAASSDDGSTALTFHDANPGEIDPDQNMTAGGWSTSIVLDVNSGSSIDLTELTLVMHLVNGSGGDNSTGSKSGRMTLELRGSSSGLLGTVDPGDLGYPDVNYTRTLDLSSLPTLDDSETYTLTISALGTGFGHHKSMNSLSLTGTIPEPSITLLGGLGLLGLLRRRR